MAKDYIQLPEAVRERLGERLQEIELRLAATRPQGLPTEPPADYEEEEFEELRRERAELRRKLGLG